VVPVTGEDLVRLSAGTGVALHRLVACAPQPTPTPAGFLLSPDGPAHELVLAAQAGHPARPCAFLRDDGARVRCEAYPFRPRACRRFPAARCERGVRVREGIVCEPGAWTTHHVERLSFRTALLREEREAALYAEVVARWNAGIAASGRAPATALAFLDHVAETYAWLLRWRAALRPRQRASPDLPVRVREALRAFPAG